MKEKKKNRKLLFQIGTLLIPVFSVMIILVSVVIYYTTVNGFLGSQRVNMESKLSKAFDDLMENSFVDRYGLEWAISQWEKDPKSAGEEITEEELQKYSDFVNSYDGSTDMKEYINAMPEQLWHYYSKVEARSTREYLIMESDLIQAEHLFFIDITEPNLGMVFCEARKEGTVKQFGERYELDVSEHPAVEKMLESSSEEIVFERSEDFPEEGSYYIAYKPIVIDGKARAALGMVYNWEDLRKTLTSSMKTTRILSIGAIVLALSVLLLMLYLKSIKPLSKIQEAVEKYTDTKDTPQIVSDMYDIKSRNEFGYLADSIADLALEIEHYTKENVRIAQERERAEKELYEAKVSIMVSQIQPHFMYNALSSIAMMCVVDPETAQEATVNFADYLRGNMDSLKRTKPVPFEMELEHLKKYLYIEKLRFGRKLNIEYDIQTTAFSLPQLSIQPLVENAVKHGVGMKKKGGTVTISTMETQDAFIVTVTDDGVGFDTAAPKPNDGRSHIGMETTKKRLKDMCGADIEITSVVGEGTTAKVILPKEEQDNEDTLC